MKVCPCCREEFLDHVGACAECGEQLVGEDIAILQPKKHDFLSKEELLQQETIPFLEGSLSHCREIEKILNKSRISCAVYPLSLENSNDAATLGATSDMRYVVLIRPCDIELSKIALEGNFLHQVALEGKGKVVLSTIDLEKDVVTCPACHESHALIDGECASCGLFLGVIN
jgi:hypothetical protein